MIYPGFYITYQKKNLVKKKDSCFFYKKKYI